MEQAITKAAALVEAMGYIQKFHGKIVVVKVGGSILDDAELMKKLTTDIAFMSIVGMRPIIVHGGGKAISQAMEESGLQPQWVQGRRYTDERTLAIAEHTLINKVNKPICECIRELGLKAMGMHSLSTCVVFGEKLRLDGENGRKIDLGLVGRVVDVNADILRIVCNTGVIPVIASIGLAKTGGKLNINADCVAGKIAEAVKAEKLVLLSDTHGIRRDIDDPESYISTLTEVEIEDMIKDGTITSGMMPKVEACLNALNGGVPKAHIIDGRFEHSLLLEIYTEKGIGTQILK